MKYYLIAGEASGDLHGSNLMKQIRLFDEQAEFRFWGGDLMQQQSGILVKHYKDLAFMGFIEVAMNLKTILNNLSFCKKDLAEFQPDCIILIDYPGFNLRIAEYTAKELNTKVYYYISPQVWAWKANRVHKIKRTVDAMFTILPFESDFYKKYDYEVEFVGHPLLDAIKDFQTENSTTFRKKWDLHPTKKIIALLPGSRKQEIKKMLPIMLSIFKDFPEYEFVVAGAPSQSKKFYREFIPNDVRIVSNETYSLLQNSYAALVTSGTATLEAALFNVPEVVCYTGSRISYEIAKRVVKHIDYIALVNLIMDREVVKELIQNQLNYNNLKAELEKLLQPETRQNILSDYQVLKQKLGGSGASERTAEWIVNDLKNK